MFGGSPIIVAAPPMLAARTPKSARGRPDPEAFAIESVTGTISTTVVTLSRKAEATAVTSERMTSSRAGAVGGLAGADREPLEDAGLGMMWAMIIIPASRKMTLRSTAAKASAWIRMEQDHRHPAGQRGDRLVPPLRGDNHIDRDEDDHTQYERRHWHPSHTGADSAAIDPARSIVATF